MAYKSLILLDGDSDASIVQAEEVLRSYFSDDDRKISIQSEEEKIIVTIENWKCSIYFNSEPYVIEESKEIVENSNQLINDRDSISASPRRFEVICDEDFEMNYFNDYLGIIQELGNLKGARIWEQSQQAFI